jgi:hypothetical protein
VHCDHRPSFDESAPGVASNTGISELTHGGVSVLTAKNRKGLGVRSIISFLLNKRGQLGEADWDSIALAGHRDVECEGAPWWPPNTPQVSVGRGRAGGGNDDASVTG